MEYLATLCYIIVAGEPAVLDRIQSQSNKVVVCVKIKATHGTTLNDCPVFPVSHRRHSGLMVSVLVSGSSCPGSSPGWGHCIVFLDKTLYSHCTSLPQGTYKWVQVN